MTAAIVVDDRSVREAFNRLVATGENPQPWLTAIGRDLEASTKLRFRDSQAPSGAAWAGLSPVTIALRRGGGARAKPLLDTGRLANSITSSTGPNYVEVGTNVIYARFQHYGAAKGAFGRTSRGSPIPWGNVPGRPFLGLSQQDRASVLEVLTEAFNRAGA
jgi:phage virion morphogenesis protein